jgi:GNAT superfamily N-acetyltransferase
VQVRPYTIADFPALLEIQRACFPAPYPEDQLWSVAQIQSHVQHFPQGALCVEYSGRLIASATALVLEQPPHTFAAATDNGFIGNHNPHGDTLYGVDMAVHPAFRGRGVARLLYQARFDLVQQLGLRRFLAAGRIPGLCQHPQLSPEAYVAKVVAGELSDPTLTPQLKNGLHPLEVLHGYIPDEESRDCALLLEWQNIGVKPSSSSHLQIQSGDTLLPAKEYR